jgi:hypothetical protein
VSGVAPSPAAAARDLAYRQSMMIAAWATPDGREGSGPLRSSGLEAVLCKRNVLCRRGIALVRPERSSISTPFLVIVVFWLTVLFVSFGLFAPRTRLRSLHC